MAERQGFVTGGTWCVDYNMTLARWPAEETASRILSTMRQGGGAGCNFGVDVRRLAPEIPVATVALCGADGDGALLRGIAQGHGIDTAQFHVDPRFTTHRVMAFTGTSNGSRTHLFEAEAADHLTPDHFDFARSRARMLHLGPAARAAGLQTNLEVMTIEPDELRRLVAPCLPHLDYLVVNDYEIGALTGIGTLGAEGTSVPAVLAAAQAAMAMGAMRLVVVHFPQGALALDRGGALVQQPSVRVPKEGVVGTNGAGDAFVAGFFCGIHRGRPLQECLTFAHAAAAASLRSVDTFSAVETIERCLALAESYGWRPPLRLADAPTPHH